MPTYLYYLLAKSGGNNSKQRWRAQFGSFEINLATLIWPHFVANKLATASHKNYVDVDKLCTKHDSIKSSFC